MKKLLSILLSAGIAMLVACGPSAEEQAKEEQRKQDSIAEVKRKYDDSVGQAMEIERLKADSAAKALQDSIAAAEAKKPAPKKTNEQKMKEDKKILEKEKG